MFHKNLVYIFTANINKVIGIFSFLNGTPSFHLQSYSIPKKSLDFSLIFKFKKLQILSDLELFGFTLLFYSYYLEY